MGDINQAELARRLGVGKTRVTQYKHEGMPVGSYESALSWLSLNYPDRVIEIVGADFSSKINGDVALPDELVADDLSSKGVGVVVARAAMNESFAWKMLKEALESSDRVDPHKRVSEILVYTKHYNTTSEARLKAEKEIAEHRVKTGELVAVGDVIDLINKILSPIKVQLTALPFVCASRCNPIDPDLAREVISAEIERMKSSIRKAFDELLGGQA